MRNLGQRARAVLPLAASVVMAGASAAVHADPVDDLKAQVDDLQKKVGELEKGHAPSGAVTGGATKGSFKLPGSDTSVTIGGYVKLDAVFSDKSAGVNSSADQELEPGSIPVGPTAGANEKNQLKMHARQSRFFIKTSTPTRFGEVGSYVEFDLFGTAGNDSVSNSNNLRVRHAYGTIGQLLAGQTWTTLSDPAVYPETVDFGGPVGVIFARQAQVRWTQPFAGGEWAVAVENPETVVTLANGSSFRADDDRLPDFAGNVKFNTPYGKYTFAGMVRQMRIDSAADPAAVLHKWGGVVGANAVVGVGADDIRATYYVGNAIGRYSVGFFNDALLGTTGGLKLPSQWVATVAYRHFWMPGLRSTLAISGLHSANAAGTAGGVNRSAQSLHANLIWSPVAQTNLGLEFIEARRAVQNGQSGTLHRLQASAQYLF